MSRFFVFILLLLLGWGGEEEEEEGTKGADILTFSVIAPFFGYFYFLKKTFDRCRVFVRERL